MTSFFKRFLFEEEDNPRVRTRTQTRSQAKVSSSLRNKKVDTVEHGNKDWIKDNKDGVKVKDEDSDKVKDKVVTALVENDVKVITITKSKKKQSEWNDHVARYKKEHPELSGSELFKQAKRHYNKQMKLNPNKK